MTYLSGASIELSPEEAYLIINEYDANGDGSLDYIEFMQLCLPAADAKL